MGSVKNIVLGVCGGIAAYKACELVRLFVRGGFSVTVVMTASAREFVTPLTFATLSGNPVATGLFSDGDPERVKHIDLADGADLVVVAPATANIIGKVAAGVADDLLSTVIMATKAPVLFCPAMNVNMYENPIVTENIARLKKLGYRFVEPTEGFLACGWEGKGRMAEPADIYDAAASIVGVDTGRDLEGLRILVTAGPTREAIDPVRFISNRSSGKMGFAIADRARHRGAEVVLISGPTYCTPPAGVETVTIESAADMAREVRGRFDAADVVIKAAAVLDFTPKSPHDKKVKKEECADVIELSRTEDILASLGKDKGDKILVGFAAETHDLEKNAQSKLKVKNLDLIVANDVSHPESGFETDTNIVKIFGQDGIEESLPMLTKEEVADRVLRYVKDVWQKKKR
jgi:phosphopantothenoylcysteine decarboxylase/phosphopantothenate--cysteine ligase